MFARGLVLPIGGFATGGFSLTLLIYRATWLRRQAANTDGPIKIGRGSDPAKGSAQLGLHYAGAPGGLILMGLGIWLIIVHP